MKTVNILIGNSWADPSKFLGQTPGGRGIWGDCQFFLNSDEYTDYAIISNHSDIKEIKAEHVWTILMEPPVMDLIPWHEGHPQSERVFTCWDKKIDDKKYVASHGALPWEINKTYDELIEMPELQKEKSLSWITSNAYSMPGHKKRMNFLREIHGKLNFDLYGRGFNPVEDKFTAYRDYKYSIAVENYSGDYLFTDKLFDCWLSYTLPFYYGCTNLDKYFPKESYVWIDINDPDKAIEAIRSQIFSNAWENRFDAICEAREIFLNKWQFFPYMVDMISQGGQKYNLL